MNPNESVSVESESGLISKAEGSVPLNLRTPFLYLLGYRRAIRSLVETPGALWLGLAFVFSAGLAREYDGEYLFVEPWHLLIPLGASLVTSFVLYNLLWVVARRWGLRKIPYWKTYRHFLTLYWMTAPLAWLYAIPVERLFGAGTATAMNLRLLLVVSVWRVLLIARGSSLLLGEKWWKVFFLVMLFADGVALLLLDFLPIPVMAIMGGIRMSESENVIAEFSFFVSILGMLTLPFWAFWSLFALIPERTPAQLLPGEVAHSLPRRLWGLPLFAAVVIAGAMPWTQAEQRLRFRVERAFAERHFEEGLAVMSAHARDSFPPHWDPPPRRTYFLTGHLELLSIFAAIDKVDVSPWVREEYREKYDLNGKRLWHQMEPIELEKYLVRLNSSEMGKSALQAHREEIIEFIKDRRVRLDRSDPETFARIEKLVESLPQPKRLPMPVR